ncbi:cell division protein FtsL [Tepidicaulis sp.]|jgi:cell division protein FtsL|uniref:cell division protein FtsL n=1 Tax=Tepidicaulis sp. TaxID=1920809 RepID=UPI003B58F1DD
MIRFLNALSFILVIALSVVLYNVKYRIDAQENAQAKLQQDILNEEDAIRVLRAEHSYLTQPDRLQALADRHLQLAPLHASQIATFDDLPMPPRDEDFFGPAGRRALGGYAGIAPSTGVQ